MYSYSYMESSNAKLHGGNLKSLCDRHQITGSYSPPESANANNRIEQLGALVLITTCIIQKPGRTLLITGQVSQYLSHCGLSPRPASAQILDAQYCNSAVGRQLKPNPCVARCRPTRPIKVENKNKIKAKFAKLFAKGYRTPPRLVGSN